MAKISAAMQTHIQRISLSTITNAMQNKKASHRLPFQHPKLQVEVPKQRKESISSSPTHLVTS
jgi:hypothetical protein